MHFNRDQVRQAIENRPAGFTAKDVINRLIEDGNTIEGLEHRTVQPVQSQEEEKGFLQRAGEVLTAPGDLLKGGVERGINATVEGLTGRENVNLFGEDATDQGLRQNLSDTGTFTKFAAPVGAAIATGGASIPATMGISAAAGASGQIVEDVTDFEDETAGEVAKNAIKAGAIDAGIDAVTLGLARVVKPLAKGLKAGALDDVGKLLNPTTKKNKAITKRISQELVDRPFSDTASLTLKGMQENATAAREAAGKAFDEAGELTGVTEVGKVVESLEAQKAAFVVDGKVIDDKAIKVIEGVQDTFSRFGDEIPDESLRRVQRILSKQVDNAGGFGGKSIADGTEIDIKREAVSSIRSILSEAHPDLAKLNKEFSFWKGLETVLSDTNTRRVGQKGFLRNMATIIGAASGNTPAEAVGKGLVFRTVAEVIQSPVWRLTSAKFKDSLADAIASGSTKKVRVLLKEAERLRDQASSK